MADSIAGAVASAVAQEVVVGRVVSGLVLLAGAGKREEKTPASQLQAGAAGHNVERLKMAVSQLEFALERTRKLPITDVSLLEQRKMFKLAYIEATGLLLLLTNNKQQEGRVNPKRRRRWIPVPFITFWRSSSSSPSIIDAGVVRRFEWFADCAGRFVRDVAESGSTLRHHSFGNPVVSRLLEGKHLRYEAERGAVLRFLDLWPLCIEGRGVETILEYHYQDRGAPEKNLLLHVVLRLSECTDIFGTAIACLQAMASSQLKLLVSDDGEAAVGELALLATSPDISRSVAPPWSRIDEGDYTRASQAFRQDPVCCCKGNNWQQQQLGHGGRRPRASTSSGGDNTASSPPELSQILPEQIIVLAFWCCVPAPEECSSLLSSTSSSRCRRPPLKMTVFFSPHACYHDAEEEQQQQRSWALDLAAAGEKGNPTLLREVSVQQVAEMVRPKAIDCFLRQPHLPLYAITWGSKHGKAIFIVEKPANNERPGAGAGGAAIQIEAEEPRNGCKPQQVHGT